ncbi:MAG: GNAT family N-acetyltransferase [Acidobacteriota bacterium]|nr:GNAT family N-acetyltransferase [Acidobacteriota bacterium]MDE3162390.1 GNAT family N-acetyltransferase [Acidobacteriota bacterium]
MILLRDCAGLDEYEACVRLQVETWGYDASDVIPRKVFIVAKKIGGQIIGAFDTELPGAAQHGGADSLVAFAFSLPGIKLIENRPLPYLHSHMLAVREPWRNRGIGTQLKLEQRREALKRGIRRMEWTFDPLEIRNAYLNIHKLGAIVRTYHADFYGVSSSRLQGGLQTDRLVAEWMLDSPRVHAVLEDTPRESFKVIERIAVPVDVYEWKASGEDRHRAREVQQQNRLRFEKAFANGLAVLGYTRDEQGNGVFELGLPQEGTYAA